MTDRHTADSITDDALDALYERLDAAEESESQRQLATAREALASATTRAARAEHELTALRKVARGYCPHCGRGDAAPTVEDWEQQKQRADRAEAAITRICTLHREEYGCCTECTGSHAVLWPCPTIRSLDAPAAATQTTDRQEQPRA